MTNPFKDQRTFMQACDQTVHDFNIDQFLLYINLIKEECAELQEAMNNNDQVETLDALIDILVVTVGAIHSMGADGEGAWREVMRSNLSKIEPITGKVRKREDGKVLKPNFWQAPQLGQFLNKK